MDTLEEVQRNVNDHVFLTADHTPPAKLDGAASVAVLDYHTGRGPYDHAFGIVHDSPDSELAGQMRD